MNEELEKVLTLLKTKNIPYLCNDNISTVITDDILDTIQSTVEYHFEEILKALLIDIENDHNTRETAKRVAKMYVRELFKGRYENCPSITDFPNALNLDQLYVVGPIDVRSMCAHHMVPIVGQAWCGVVPDVKDTSKSRVIGLSKFNRISDWVMSRPQIQEEATVQLADYVEKTIKPYGLGIVVKSNHLCMSHRGVKDSNTQMTTSVLRGCLKNNPSVRSEFYSILKAHDF